MLSPRLVQRIDSVVLARALASRTDGHHAVIIPREFFGLHGGMSVFIREVRGGVGVEPRLRRARDEMACRT